LSWIHKARKLLGDSALWGCFQIAHLLAREHAALFRQTGDSPEHNLEFASAHEASPRFTALLFKEGPFPKSFTGDQQWQRTPSQKQGFESQICHKK
jgi:hypothetical protein